MFLSTGNDYFANNLTKFSRIDQSSSVNSLKTLSKIITKKIVINGILFYFAFESYGSGGKDKRKSKMGVD